LKTCPHVMHYVNKTKTAVGVYIEIFEKFKVLIL